MHLGKTCAVMSALLGIVSLAVAQNVAPQRETQQILASVERFADALKSGDRKAVVQAVSIVEGSQRQFEQRELFASLIEAEKKLEREAEQRWGAEGRKLRCGFENVFTEEDRKLLARAQVFLDDGTVARVVMDGETSAIRVRRNSVGLWQVVVDMVDYEADPDQSVSPWMESRQRIRRDRYRGYAEAVAATLVKVQKGEFNNAQAAEADLLERFARVSAEVSQRMNALSNGPFQFR
jgi:hypothetical protein